MQQIERQLALLDLGNPGTVGFELRSDVRLGHPKGFSRHPQVPHSCR